MGGGIASERDAQLNIGKRIEQGALMPTSAMASASRP